jgi:hypothetical protein
MPPTIQNNSVPAPIMRTRYKIRAVWRYTNSAATTIRRYVIEIPIIKATLVLRVEAE